MLVYQKADGQLSYIPQLPEKIVSQLVRRSVQNSLRNL